MNDKTSRTPRRKRTLNEAEKQLWHEVTRNINQYKAIPKDFGEPIHERSSPVREKGSGLPATKDKLKNKNSGKKTPTITKPTPLPLGAAKRAPQSVSRFQSGDPAMEKRVRRGRIAIDAVLDLHGLTQIAAEERLRRFITLAQVQDARCVLVVTGKGSPEPQRPPAFEMYRAPRGILRQRFQEWVEQPPLRDLVTRVAKARPSDGGGGAFYVFIKPRSR